ncbi:MAG: hypothetical protein ACKVZ0_04280 [Gemmatimonadales bacterium]
MGAKVAAAALASWVLPERLWFPLTRAIARAEVGLRFGRRGAAPLPFDDGLAGGVAREVRSIVVERIASGHASRLWGLREYLRHRRHPPIAVAGLGQVASALAANRGAILWVGRFTWASIITKVGLHGAGCPVTHLSRPTHGFGTSPFAVRRLNPVWTRIEERFLRERLVMEPGSETTALRALRGRLADNGVVSISVGDEGARTIEVPFLDGRLRLATGPLHLAAASGAALLPVFTLREPTGTFRVEIEPALSVTAEEERDERDARMARDYAARLERWVRRYPGQWLG